MNLNYLRHSKYEVKNLKGFQGMECPGFNATLYTRGGKRIATIIQDGSGGPVSIEFIDKAEEDAFVAYIKTLPRDPLSTDPVIAKMFPEGMEVTDDIYISQLADLYRNDKRMSRLCKKETLFRLKGDGEGCYRTLNVKWGPTAKDYLDKHHGQNIEEILNATLGVY